MKGHVPKNLNSSLKIMELLKKNRIRFATFVVLALMFGAAMQGMDSEDWLITVLRGLATGMLIFLVASGLSLIFGLMDVLNLAHGELFMLGAYVGWTVFVRPDTFVDIMPLLLLLAVGFVLLPVWRALIARRSFSGRAWRIWPWLVLLVALAVLYGALTTYPIAIWDPEVYANSPITFSLALSQGNLLLPQGTAVLTNTFIGLGGTLLGGLLLGIALAGFEVRRQPGAASKQFGRSPLIASVIMLLLALAFVLGNDALTAALLGMSTTVRFLIAMVVVLGMGFVLGGLIEVVLIRPLYDRPIYQLMMTLGLSFILIEVVQAIWGRPEFTMPKAALFDGSGEGCPATNLGEWLANKCATVILFDGRIRTYNEVFIIIVGLIVLLVIWLLLQRTRIGMIIRAGVQDSEMVEALGINVRLVFTFIFALGVALAAFGGILAAPSTGLSTSMGTQFLLLALIALAIGAHQFSRCGRRIAVGRFVTTVHHQIRPDWHQPALPG
ncbi:MAG: branched-chain amino acid ABC transporter permease [Anaerolineae bacterium]|nr:branched-chain amino acid ABC transporter permease [Anaerolineae bacterium]